MKATQKLVVLIALFAVLCSLTLFNSAYSQGDVTDFTSVRVTNFFRAQPRTALTVTNNGTINVTGSLQLLTAAGAVGTSGDNLTIKPAGTQLVLVNSGSNTITITETANLISAGNLVLGAGDTATLYSDGVDWRQTGFSNN